MMAMGLLTATADSGSGVEIHFEIFFFHHFGCGSSMLVPLLTLQYIEFWLGCTPIGTNSGFGIDLY